MAAALLVWGGRFRPPRDPERSEGERGLDDALL